MIILDFNQVCISNIIVHMTSKSLKEELDEGLVRHTILNSFRFINNRFKRDYGDLVIAIDGKNTWRKKVFPYYKAGRKKSQDKSPVDWIKLFDYLNRIKPELKAVLPYKVVEVESCEADDIIGVLTRYASNNERVMIVSGDKDFIQLHNENVRQYDPVNKKNVSSDLPGDRFLIEHIFRGDPGDGIPNILSDDDTFVNPTKRQHPLTRKKMEAMSKDFGPVAQTRNWKRNEQLIRLTHTPEELTIKIMDEYANAPKRNRAHLMNYMWQNNCRQLVEAINDF